MKILAIDTSSKYLSLAIAEGEKAISSFHRAMEQRQCERLMPEIDNILRKAKLKLKDIDCIAFSKGPGALTSLRIGAATVKGLALAAGIKIVGVPTLDALAYNSKDNGRFIVPVIDARRGNVYASIYSFKNSKLRRHFKYSVLTILDLIKYIKGDAVFLGDGLAAYRKTLEENFKFRMEFAPERYWYTRGPIIAKLGYELAKSKEFEEADSFVPMYLYPKDIQVRNLK